MVIQKKPDKQRQMEIAVLIIGFTLMDVGICLSVFAGICGFLKRDVKIR